MATAIAVPIALGAGLAVGNAIYEDVLGRPWGPSVGDYLRQPREQPQRDGSSESYPGVGPAANFSGGQGDGTVYVVRGIYTDIDYRRPEPAIREFGFATVTGPIQEIYIENGSGSHSIYAKARGNLINMYYGTGSAYYWTDLRNITFERVGGAPDPGTNPIPRPLTVNPSNPYRPEPLPLTPASPALSPLSPAQPLAPTPEPAPAPAPAPTPYPGSRPSPDKSPFPIPPLIPARAPSPKATPTPTPKAPSGPSSAPPSSKQGTRCPCSGVTVGGVAQKIDPIVQAQQVGNATAVGQGAAQAAILAKLVQMQAFAEKAWENSRLNKLINLLTLISVLHNAAMLSRDVGETIGDLTSNLLSVVGIKDEKGSQLNINELVGGSVKSFIQSVVGVAVYNDVSTRWKKASRILSSAAMVVYTVRGLNDTSKDILEWTAENTGKIGNALKRWGVVGERAYPWMSERVRAQDAYRRKFERVTQGLEGLEDTASSLDQVAGNAKEIQEEYAELKQQKDAFKALITTTPPAAVPTAAPESAPIANTETAATAASASADVAIADGQKGG